MTFKPGIDDLREAPSLENIPLLLAQGANLCVYDPVGIDSFKRSYPEDSPDEMHKAGVEYYSVGRKAITKSILPL